MPSSLFVKRISNKSEKKKDKKCEIHSQCCDSSTNSCILDAYFANHALQPRKKLYWK